MFLGAGCGLYGPNDATGFQATVTGDAERPDPVDTDGMGTGIFSLNADETQLRGRVKITYS